MTSEECYRRGMGGGGMYPADLLSIFKHYRHPQYWTMAVQADRWGARQREAFGLRPHGTIFATGVAGEKFWFGSVPQNEIPERTIKSAEMDYDSMRWKHGELLIGWRGLLTNLCKQGVLEPCQEMEWLTGRKMRALVEKHLWTHSTPINY